MRKLREVASELVALVPFPITQHQAKKHGVPRL